jgi:hypothetical protein
MYRASVLEWTSTRPTVAKTLSEVRRGAGFRETWSCPRPSDGPIIEGGQDAYRYAGEFVRQEGVADHR